MQKFDYLVGLRNEIKGQIGGIENAKHSLWWDDTASNYSTRSSLTRILQKYTAAAYDLGILVVTRHSTCPNKKHKEYPTSNLYDLRIPYRSADFVWEGYQLFQGNRLSVCPCSAKNTVTEHWVIDDLVFKPEADLDFCRHVSRALSDIQTAIEKSAANKPRSGIREHLLRALLTVNDVILPEPVDEYIKWRLSSGIENQN